MKLERSTLLLALTVCACRTTPETSEVATEEAEAVASAEEEGPEREGPPFELLEGERMYTVLERDAIPSIDDPTFVSATEASASMRDDETVLGVVGQDGTAKAYSTWHLDGHEIVNDQLDGTAIAATW